MKTIILNKVKKNYLVIITICAVAILSSFSTYYLMSKNEKKTTSIPVIDTSVDDKKFITSLMPETKTFEDKSIAIKEKLSKQVSYTKGINTFEMNDIRVTTQDFLLPNKDFIRLISYLDNSDNYSIQYYFLQYVGDTTYFNNAVAVNAKNYIYLHVFELDDTVYAFLQASDYTNTEWLTDVEYRQYFVSLFTLGNNAFIETKDIFPYKVPAHDVLQFSLEDNKITAGLTQTKNESKFVFDPQTLTFTPMLGIQEQKPIQYDLPGVLVGLSNSQGQLRTLYLYKKDDKIQVEEILDKIIFERNHTLHTLQYYNYLDEKYLKDFPDRLESKTDISKLYSRAIDDSTPYHLEIINQDTIINRSFPIRSSKELPLFIGEDYISYIRTEVGRSGGTLNGGKQLVHFNTLEQLEQVNFTNGHMTPLFDEKSLVDILFKDQASTLYQDNLTRQGERSGLFLDFDQLVIKRNVGIWSIMAPIYKQTVHPGNGSNSIGFERFATFSNTIPESIVSSSTNYNIQQEWRYWDARDIFQIPTSPALFIQHDTFIGVNVPNEEMAWEHNDIFDLKVACGVDEFIVSIDYLNEQSKDDWSKIIQSLK